MRTKEDVVTRTTVPGDLAAAVDVWRAANIERGKSPNQIRIVRVRTKLTDPAALAVVVVTAAEPATHLGMALAEPGRADDGFGVPVPELCHISMVFVHPEHWGRGIGHLLLDHVAALAWNRGHTRLQLWTGQSNHRAQRLYLHAGFVLTGRTKHLDGGELVRQLARDMRAG